MTLSEHRAKHEADYSMLVGPDPSTRRLLDRAQDQSVAVLSADALADLCRSHAAQPLGLADYKSMFQSGGAVDLAHIREKSNKAERLASLARRLLDVIGEAAERFGPVIARDLHRGLGRDDGNVVATELEIQSLLHTLSSPLVGAIQGDSDNGYVLACSPAVTAERLRSQLCPVEWWGLRLSLGVLVAGCELGCGDGIALGWCWPVMPSGRCGFRGRA